MDYGILKELCEIFGPSGSEYGVRDFIINYIRNNKEQFKAEPKLVFGDHMQDCLIVEFGQPRTAIFAHMDSHGFTVRYENQLLPIGQPVVENGFELVGEDHLGPILCKLKVDKEHNLFYDFGRPLGRGTQLVFNCDFRETEDNIQSCYLDNRLGVMMVLEAAKHISNGVLCFSCWEEHGGGSVPYLASYIYEKHKIRQAIVADITWVTDGVGHNKGTVISMRDRNVPRRKFIDKVIGLADTSGISFQLEVEGSGSSDGRELQTSPYPFDWCFVGPPEDHVHSPDELVHKNDITGTIQFYTYLMNEL